MKNLRNTHILVALLGGGIGVGIFSWWIYHKKRKHHSTRRKQLVPVIREKIHVINADQEWETVFPELNNDLKLYKVLGFDCEWLNSEVQKNRPVSVLQLASCSGLCLLIRGNVLKKCPWTLRNLLDDRSVLKAGVACIHDAKKLYQDHGITVKGCVDLRHIASRCRLKNLGGLAALSEDLLKFEMNKDLDIRVSNWEDDPLSEEQIEYAATDAAVGIELFLNLVERKYFSLPRRGEIWQTATSMCQGIVDLGFSYRRNDHIEKGNAQNGSSKPAPSKPVSRAYSSRQKPLYHNCQLWAPDGQLLCTCDVKKALWYIEKGLGEKVGDDPLTVKLRFEPSGRPMEEKNYYLQDKENVCVICGSEDSYIRKNIVPHEYRKYFPPMMKEHKSHDIVLMCLPCHQRSSGHDSSIKLRLAEICDAPCSTENGRKFSDDQYLVKVRSAAKALLLSSAKLPKSRKAELENVVQGYFGIEDVSKDMLKEAAEMDVKIKNSKFVAHGEKVVKHMMENEGLVSFERMWRQHFLDTMDPKFLPDLWSVDHCHQELQSLDEDLKQIINA